MRLQPAGLRFRREFLGLPPALVCLACERRAWPAALRAWEAQAQAQARPLVCCQPHLPLSCRALLIFLFFPPVWPCPPLAGAGAGGAGTDLCGSWPAIRAGTTGAAQGAAAPGPCVSSPAGAARVHLHRPAHALRTGLRNRMAYCPPLLPALRPPPPSPVGQRRSAASAPPPLDAPPIHCRCTWPCVFPAGGGGPVRERRDPSVSLLAWPPCV